MTQPPPLPPSPFGAATDEALNALLDGELGAFADEHGLAEADVRAQLEAWPGYTTALAALTNVRAAVGHAGAAPELDDITRRRLVRTAVNAVPGQAQPPAKTRRPWATIVAAAAAALIVVVGIGFAISSSGDSRSDSAKRAAGGSASTAGAPLKGAVGDLGDVSTPEALRALLAPGTSTTTAAAPGEHATDSTGSPQADAAAPFGQSKSANGESALTPQECARQLAGDRPVTFFGTGTYQGAPVTIVGLPNGGRTVVFVVSSSDCAKVLASISR